MLLDLYKGVFDENGNIKVCGRDKCISLIKKLHEIDKSTDYGNVETGFMHIQNIKETINKIYN